MQKKLSKRKLLSGKEIQISGSKSETNRVLLLQALFPEISMENASNSDDSQVMTKALQQGQGTIDIHHAGTAMRFLTAFFAIQQGKNVILTGSPRMKERPIEILVNALNDLGADISYLEKEGFPPLHIKGKKLINSTLQINSNTSSQYISALLLIAPFLDNGLKINLIGNTTSVPYIKMTLDLLTQIGVENSFIGNRIEVKNFSGTQPQHIVIESDWSSASYWYSFVALSEIGTNLTLSAYKSGSLQGDSVLAEIYTFFGVRTTFVENKIRLEKITSAKSKHFVCDLQNTPDIAQTLAVTCLAMEISCELLGLHTLKIKETDRLYALKTELTKLGASVEITDDTLTIKECSQIKSNIAVDTYNDHRMAMAFAPLMLKTDIIINDSQVVSKSYPDFWNDLDWVIA